MEFHIIPMNAEMAAEVARLETVCFSDPWSLDSVLAELENEYAAWLCAVDEAGTVIGYGGVHVLYGEGEIMNIAVAPSARCGGIGTALMTALIAAASDAEAIFLEVRASNDAAIRLYERFGFVRIAVRKNYYSLPTEDAHIMRKEMKK